MLTRSQQKQQIATECGRADNDTAPEPLLSQTAQMSCRQSRIRRRGGTSKDYLPSGRKGLTPREKRLQKCGGERDGYWHAKGSWGLGTRDWLSRPRKE